MHLQDKVRVLHDHRFPLLRIVAFGELVEDREKVKLRLFHAAVNSLDLIPEERRPRLVRLVLRLLGAKPLLQHLVVDVGHARVEICRCTKRLQNFMTDATVVRAEEDKGTRVHGDTALLLRSCCARTLR